MKRIIPAVTFAGLVVLGLAQTNTNSIVVAPAATISTNVPPESTAVAAKDIRMVSGIRVDLGPIHDYERSRTGERPLKHWKKISFQTIGTMAAGQSTCIIKIEGGGEITAVVKNIPANISDAYANTMKLADQQQKLAAQVDRDSKVATERVQAVQNYADAVGVDPNQLQQVVAQNNQLQTNATELARLGQSVNQAAAYFASISTEYAMFTGQKARELEIWDCGIKLK